MVQNDAFYTAAGAKVIILMVVVVYLCFSFYFITVSMRGIVFLFS